MPKISLINDKYGTGGVYEFDIQGEEATAEEKKFIDFYLKESGVLEKQIDAEQIIDTTGVKDAGIRYGFANVEKDEEKQLFLDGLVGSGNYFKRLNGTYALTPEGREVVGQPGDVPLSIEDKGFSRYDLVDFAGEGGIALGAAAGVGILTGGAGLLPALAATAVAGGVGKLIDEGIEHSKGLQRQSASEVAKDALTEAAIAGTGEFGGRLLTSFVGRFIKGSTTNAQRAEHRRLLKWAKENDVTYVPDLATVSGKPLLARVQALTEQVLGNKRGPVIRESLETLVQTISRTDGIPIEEAQRTVLGILERSNELAQGAAETVAKDIAGVYGESVEALGERAARAIAGGNREELEAVTKSIAALDNQSMLDLMSGYSVIKNVFNKEVDFLNSPAYRTLMEGKRIPLDDGEFVSPIKFRVSQAEDGVGEVYEPLVVDVSSTLRIIDDLGDQTFPDKSSVKEAYINAFGRDLYEAAKQNQNYISLDDYGQARFRLNSVMNSENNLASRRLEAAPVGRAPVLYRSLTEDFTKSMDDFGRVINQLDDNLTSMTPSEELVNLAATALGREAVVEGPAKTRNVKILRNKLSDIRSTMRALRQMNGVFGAQREIFEDAGLSAIRQRLKQARTVDGNILATDIDHLADIALKNPNDFDKLAKFLSAPLRSREETAKVLEALQGRLTVRGRTQDVAEGLSRLTDDATVAPETIRFGGKTSEEKARNLLGNVMMRRLYTDSVDVVDGVGSVNLVRFAQLADKNRKAMRTIMGDNSSSEFLDIADQIRATYKEFGKDLPPSFNSLMDDVVNRGMNPNDLKRSLRSLKEELKKVTGTTFERSLLDPDSLDLEKAASLMVGGKVPLQTVRATLDRLRDQVGDEGFDAIEQSLKDAGVKKFFSNIAGNGDDVSDISTINPVDAILNFRQLKNMIGTGQKSPTMTRETLEYVFERGGVTGNEAIKSLENLARFAEFQAGRATSGKGTIAGANLGLALGAGLLIDPLTTVSTIAGLGVLSKFFSNPAFVKLLSRPKKESLRLLRQDEKGGIPEKAFLQAWTNLTRTIVDGGEDGSIPMTREEVQAQQEKLDKLLKIDQQPVASKTPTVRKVPPAPARVVSPQQPASPQPVPQPVQRPQAPVVPPQPAAGISSIPTGAQQSAGLASLRRQQQIGLAQPYRGVSAVRV